MGAMQIANKKENSVHNGQRHRQMIAVHRDTDKHSLLFTFDIK